MRRHNNAAWLRAGWLSIGLALIAIALFSLYGCNGASTGSTVGNGKVDPIEAATLRVAVGAALTAYPQAIAPAYAVSTALLEVTADDDVILAEVIDIVIKREVERLDLDPITLAAFNDLVVLIRAEITQRVQIDAVTGTAKVVLVRELLAIVRDAAAARMVGVA